jgi:ABC-2 type transport system permease protein
MRTTWAIFRREFSHYFNSPIAYVVLTLFLIVAGIIFWISALYFSEISSRYEMIMQQRQQFMAQVPEPPNASAILFGSFFGALLLWGLFFTIPILTMRLLAEEKRSGTIEMLFTYPIRHIEMVMGKYLAAVAVFAIMAGLTVVYPLIVYWIKPEAVSLSVMASCYLGLFLAGAAYVALGIFFSSVTQSQIVAAILSYGTLLVFLFLGFAEPVAQLGEPGESILRYLSVFTHHENFVRGIVDSGDVIFYGIVIVLSLFLTLRVVESQRWKG